MGMRIYKFNTRSSDINLRHQAGFEVLTAVTMESTIFLGDAMESGRNEISGYTASHHSSGNPHSYRCANHKGLLCLGAMSCSLVTINFTRPYRVTFSYILVVIFIVTDMRTPKNCHTTWHTLNSRRCEAFKFKRN